MNKFKNWIIRRLGGIPKDDVWTVKPNIRIENKELIKLQSRFTHLGVAGDVPKEYIKARLLEEFAKRIDFPIESRGNPAMASTEFIATIKIPKEYVKGYDDYDR